MNMYTFLLYTFYLTNPSHVISIFLGAIAEKINAETHVQYFTTALKNLGFDKVSDFAFAQVADITNLNPKIARLLKILLIQPLHLLTPHCLLHSVYLNFICRNHG